MPTWSTHTTNIWAKKTGILRTMTSNIYIERWNVKMTEEIQQHGKKTTPTSPMSPRGHIWNGGINPLVAIPSTLGTRSVRIAKQWHENQLHWYAVPVGLLILRWICQIHPAASVHHGMFEGWTWHSCPCMGHSRGEGWAAKNIGTLLEWPNNNMNRFGGPIKI